MEKTYLKRKRNRLSGYDYSTAGAYFVTICADKKKPLFARIVGEGLAPPEILLSPSGKVFQEELENLSKSYLQVSIDEYVIMPNHIHILLQIEAGGASPSPTLSELVCVLKSKTTHRCNRLLGKKTIFQRSYYDHVIRNQDDFLATKRYIQENPLKWVLDELYVTD